MKEIRSMKMSGSADVLRLKGQLRIQISGEPSPPVRHALRMLVRDVEALVWKRALIS
ncbi:hypothetical protein [Paenibacillus donghaensis]|uniref:hypothetical protein n=1 Tax=Paenibacillus donghaensis TaxID=414771 RepID=UPI0012F9D944|nr:hypothetical protein [Paenibacillus donghaensis]